MKYGTKEYKNLHIWLVNHFGSANHCENSECLKTSSRFEWALIHEKEYEKNRENYQQLCVKCHRIYDRESMIGNTNGSGGKGKSKIGHNLSQETRDKISKTRIERKIISPIKGKKLINGHYK